RVGTHAARVRAHISVADTFEVPGGRQRLCLAPVADREDRDLFTFEQLLDQERVTAPTRRLQPGVELGLGTADEDALSRRESVGVLRPDRMAMANPGDPRVSRRSMQLFAVLALGQLPGERVLAPARPHDQNLHGRSVSKGSYVRILFLWPTPVSIVASGRRSG